MRGEQGGREAVSGRLVAGAAGAYALTLALMGAVGMVPSIPWAFVPMLLLVHVPLAYPMVRVPLLAERLAARRPAALAAAAAGFGVCLVLLAPLLPRLSRAVWVLVPLALLEIHRGRLGRFGDWGRILLVLFFGYAAIWNLNYLAAAAAPQVHDAAFVAMDRAVYAAFFGAAEQGPLFPVLRSSLAVAVLQNSYTMLFSELFAVLGVLFVRREDVTRFLLTTFGIYLLGIAVFVAYPVVGPHLSFYPDLFHPALLDDHPFAAFMGGWEQEYRAARELRTENGFGYFVGLPSLHVAMAGWLQLSLRRSPLHFWMCLPINATMTASTFLLGYHWIADAVAGAALVGVVLAIRARLERSYSA